MRKYKQTVPIAEQSGKLPAVLKVIAAFLFILYFSYLIYLTFFSHLYGRGYTHRSINLVPFRSIMEYATASYNQSSILTNLFGNIVAFAPMGFLLPWIFKKLSRFASIVLIAAGISVMIEIAQYIGGVGASDIDDVILNMAGGALGYLLYRLTILVFRSLLFRQKKLPD
jgi:glycopeptide antibiotics resistance protein